MKKTIEPAPFFWALQGLCTLHRQAFSLSLAQQQLPPPYSVDAFCRATSAFGMDAATRRIAPGALHEQAFPLVAWIASDTDATQVTPALVLQADAAHVLLLEAADSAPGTVPLEQLGRRYAGSICRVSLRAPEATDLAIPHRKTASLPQWFSKKIPCD